MRSYRVSFAAALTGVALFAAACGGSAGGKASSDNTPAGGASSGGGSGKTVVVGAANFAENQIVANMYALVLDKAGFKASVKQLTTREVIVKALKSGDLDVEPDYAATLLEFLDGGKGLASPDVDATVSKLRDQIKGTNLVALEPADAIDTNGFAVRKETADQLGLKTLSDLAGHSKDLTLGGPPECPDRPFCLPGLKKVYGLEFKKFIPLDAGGPATHAALRQKKVDVGELFTTDADLDGLVMLEDDKHLQNADNVIPLANSDVVDDAFRQAIDGVQAKLTTEALQQLNGQVVGEHKDAKDVAQQWLQDNGLL